MRIRIHNTVYNISSIPEIREVPVPVEISFSSSLASFKLTAVNIN